MANDRLGSLPYRGMGETFVISGLIAKRAELAGVLVDLEDRAALVRQDLIHLDSVIRMFAPERDPAGIKPKAIPRKSRYFAMGEVSQRIREALRDARGEPLAAEDIAMQAMRDKGLDTTDTRLAADFKKRIHWTLKRLASEGKVERVGAGLGVRWRLASISETPRQLP